jgi:hypothetical protein
MMYMTINNQETYKKSILNKIQEVYIFGTLQEDINYILNYCKLLTENSSNQYFFDIVSDLEEKIVHSPQDIYVLNDIDKIKDFVQYTLIKN